MPARYNEDTLVQQTTADYLRDALGWDSALAWNRETFGPDSLLGRANDREVVLTRDLRAALRRLNPGLPEEAYDAAVREVTATRATQSLTAANREKYDLIRDGVAVPFRNAKGERERRTLRLIDFDHQPGNNRFLVVRELWVRGDLYRRRADLVGFVNGLPLLFIECKALHRDLRHAYDGNLADYKDTIPHLFHHNALILLGNGDQARIGSLTSRWEHFQEWKRLDEDEPGVVDMETALKGVANRANFLDLVENFILFDDSAGETRKIVGRNHQFLGVNRAVEAVRDREARRGKLGVFWHTQGAGKSYSMVFFTRKVHRRLGGNFTFLVLTDRDDLDTQIYKTFAGCGVVDNDRDPCRAAGGDHLRQLLGQHKQVIFSLIQKFNQPVSPGQPYTDRDDVIVISDEAHRTQYGLLADNMNLALPNAGKIGFTGTPLFNEDEITRRVFGDYVSTYDFQRAVDDRATVPLYYDARGDKLGLAVGDLNKRMAAAVGDLEIDDVGTLQRLERELQREFHIITAEKRLDQVARDFVQHYATAWESGKAMLVCIDKVTCVRMHALITRHWAERIAALERELKRAADEQEEIYLRRQIDWMRQTQAAVVISEEQGEVAAFRQWGLDVTPHRRLIKEGFDLPEALRQKPQFRGLQRLALDDAFKEPEHPFRIAIVCAMWLTGFDVPSLATLYLDKPLKAHTLMQAIARANRVYQDKNNGLIVDYIGILKYLREALATFAGTADAGHAEDIAVDPIRPEEELLAELAEAVALVRAFLDERGAGLDAVINQTGFALNAAIIAAKEAANDNDETRKRFEILCREVFRKYRACLNAPGVNAYRDAYRAIDIIYKSLQRDRDVADISDIVRRLHENVDEVIEVQPGVIRDDPVLYDISRIDFERLRREFERAPARRSTVQSLRQVIEQRLQQMMARNPLRADFQRRYEAIVDAYNREKDRATIEQTFEELLRFVADLDEEGERAAREGLDEESLAVFDLLQKPDLSAAEINRIKAVAGDLLATLKAGKLQVDHWSDKESTRDAVKGAIRDFLWSDQTGLPVDRYSTDEVTERAEEVYRHVLRVYPTVPSPYYALPSAA